MPAVSYNDLQRIGTALDVVLRPADADDGGEYRRSVLDVLKPLLGADRACYMVAQGREASFVGDYPAARLTDYGIRMEDTAPGVDMWARHERLGVHWREQLWLPICPDFYETPYYRDYVVPLQAFDALATPALLLGPPWEAELERLGRTRGLTPRQAHVAALISRRLRSREIAARLQVSAHTVRRHEEQIFLKLGVRRRTDVRAALLEPPPPEDAPPRS